MNTFGSCFFGNKAYEHKYVFYEWSGYLDEMNKEAFFLIGL